MKLGVFPAGGGTERLPRLIGDSHARELIYTGEPVDATKEAWRVGLVNRVAPAGQALAAAQDLGRTIAQRAGLTLRTLKAVMDRGSAWTSWKLSRSPWTPSASCSNPKRSERAYGPFWKRPSKKRNGIRGEASTGGHGDRRYWLSSGLYSPANIPGPAGIGKTTHRLWEDQTRKEQHHLREQDNQRDHQKRHPVERDGLPQRLHEKHPGQRGRQQESSPGYRRRPDKAQSQTHDDQNAHVYRMDMGNLRE